MTEYGAGVGGSYSAAGSAPQPAVLDTPDQTYGVPAAPTISLADYNIR